MDPVSNEVMVLEYVVSRHLLLVHRYLAGSESGTVV